MSIRNLDALFAPASVAVFGASERVASVGGTVWRNLHGSFTGRLYPVNPKHAELDGVKAYRDVAALPESARSRRDLHAGSHRGATDPATR